MTILIKIYLGLYLAHVSIVAYENFLVVSPFNDKEISCPVLQRIRARQHFPVEEDERTKNKTCQTIAASNFIQETLPILPIASKRTESFLGTSLMKMEINNTITGRNISYEAVFPCLTLNHETGNHHELFISRQFDVNLLKNGLRSAPFRLVFKQDGTDKLVPVAIAEEPVEINACTRDNSNFLDRMDFLETKDYGSNICNLTASAKLRLCAIILNAEEYRDKIAFPSYANNDEPQCFRETVRLEYYDYANKYDDEILLKKQYEVWMVQCKAMNLENQRVGFDILESNFYIFREYDSHSYFIAKYRDISLYGSYDIVGKCDL